MTHVDTTSGARTELSAASVANAAAKIANALRQEFALEPGDIVALDLPVHWQRTTWLAGAWTAGCAVSLAPAEGARLIVTSPGASPGSLAALVAAAPRAPVVAVSLHPFGLPIADALPSGVDDVTVTVRQQPDAYLFEPPDGSLPAMVDAGLPSLTQDAALAQARGLAEAWGLAAGGRLLAGQTAEPWSDYAAAFAVPLVADAAVVLMSGAGDSATVAAAEGTTARTR